MAKFKVGDKVVTTSGRKGEIREIFDNEWYAVKIDGENNQHRLEGFTLKKAANACSCKSTNAVVQQALNAKAACNSGKEVEISLSYASRVQSDMRDLQRQMSGVRISSTNTLSCPDEDSAEEVVEYLTKYAKVPKSEVWINSNSCKAANATACNASAGDSVGKWLVNEFPEEKKFMKGFKMGVTFKQVLDGMKAGKDFYGLLNCRESTEREYIFDEMSSIFGLPYDAIFRLWIRGPKDPEIIRKYGKKLGLTVAEKDWSIDFMKAAIDDSKKAKEIWKDHRSEILKGNYGSICKKHAKDLGLNSDATEANSVTSTNPIVARAIDSAPVAKNAAVAKNGVDPVDRLTGAELHLKMAISELAKCNDPDFRAFAKEIKNKTKAVLDELTRELAV